jgi:hypothetical protein
VVSVRESHLAIIDCMDRRVAFRWTPAVPIRAAAIAHASADRLVVAAATAERLLWRLQWTDRLDRVSAFRAMSVDDAVRAVKAVPGCEDLLLAGACGLYRIRHFEEMSVLAPGAYQDVEAMSGTDLTCIVAITDRGEVVRIDLK